MLFKKDILWSGCAGHPGRPGNLVICSNTSCCHAELWLGVWWRGWSCYIWPEATPASYSGWTQLQGWLPSCQSGKRWVQVINVLLHFLPRTEKEVASKAFTAPSACGDIRYAECFLMVSALFCLFNRKSALRWVQETPLKSSRPESPQKRRTKGHAPFFHPLVSLWKDLSWWALWALPLCPASIQRNRSFSLSCTKVAYGPRLSCCILLPSLHPREVDGDTGLWEWHLPSWLSLCVSLSSSPPSLSAPGFASLPGRGFLGWAPRRWV